MHDREKVDCAQVVEWFEAVSQRKGWRIPNAEHVATLVNFLNSSSQSYRLQPYANPEMNTAFMRVMESFTEVLDGVLKKVEHNKHRAIEETWAMRRPDHSKDSPSPVSSIHQILIQKFEGDAFALRHLQGALHATSRRFHRRPHHRHVAEWHEAASATRLEVARVLMASGHTRCSCGKPTSPAIQVILRCLSHMGYEHSAEAVVEALRAPGRRRKANLASKVG